MTFRDRIHPQLRGWYDASGGFDFDHLEEFVAKCNAAELANLKEDPLVSVRDQMIPGPDGAPEVKVRIYQPAKGDGRPLPCLFFYHGGGFLFGTVYRQENLCQRYVKNVSCMVVSVEYRLAPQWKAPAQLEDCYAALTWVYENAAELGVDRDRLAVSGLSAGGNLAAAMALYVREKKGPKLCLQMPLYAELDYTLDTPSAREITDTKVWCRDNCEKSWDKVLSPGKLPSPFESPALAKDLTGLPPLFSYIGQLDPGRDENIAYWTRLMDAGVACEYHVFPGCYHCFELSVPDADLSKVAYELTYAALKRAFGVEDGSTDPAE
jgi:acetyl esterase/lipase